MSRVFGAKSQPLSPIRAKYQDLLYKNAYSRALFAVWGLVIMEIRMSFRQFFTWNYPVRSLFRTLAVVFSSLARIFLGRSLKYTYAFAGEDRIIEGILKPQITQSGYYVDVGCNHPRFLSNTYGLYRKGWRGICIDANPTQINLYSLYRPKDKAIAALISDTKDERDFYEVQNDVLSTIETDFLEEYKKEGLAVTTRRMIPQTLTEVLDGLRAPMEFDLLTIDAEEHDLQVLQSLDLDAYHPRLIIIEDETFDHMHPHDNEVYLYLAEKGYMLEGFVLKNLFFKREEKKGH